jgi:serine/threonine protein kinase
MGYPAAMEDDRLVEIARGRGWLTTADIDRLQVERTRLADRGIDRSLWFLAQDLGLIDDQRARELRRSISSAHVRALTVEGWTITGRVGSGGMGEVFRADGVGGAQAAVKLLAGRLANDTEHVRRFAREARASLRLRHPHIVASLGAGAVEGTRYLVMELVEGPSLKARIQDGPLGAGEGLCLLLQVAAALDHAWSHGVLHRDVKPANILLAPARPGIVEPFCAKICDFGLAKLRSAADGGDDTPGGLTGTGLALGTPHYMSPEQASGDRELDHRSDMYGLGASLYHALLGQTLYSGKSSASIMYQQVSAPVDLALLRGAGVPAPLVDLLARLLAKRRQDRFPDWAAVLAAAAAIDPAQAGTQAAAAGTYRGPPLSPKAHAAHSEILPAVPPAPEPALPRRPWAMLAVLAAVVLAPLAGLVALRPPAELVADPASLAEVLAGADGSAPRTVRLAPGDYGALRLGRAHAGWRLVGGADTVIAGAPALRCDPGAVGITIEGVRLAGTRPGPALVVGPGAALILAGTRIDGAGDGIALDGRLVAASTAIAAAGHGLVAGVGAEADLEEVHVRAGGIAVAATHARLRWYGGGAEAGGTGLHLAAATADLRRLTVAAGGAALHLDGGGLDLDEVALAGAVGLDGGRARVEGRGVSIRAREPFRWAGGQPPGAGAWILLPPP